MQKWSIYDDVVNQSNRLYILARNWRDEKQDWLRSELMVSNIICHTTSRNGIIYRTYETIYIEQEQEGHGRRSVMVLFLHHLKLYS